MSSNKHFNHIAWAFTILMLVFTIFLANTGFALGTEVQEHTMGYEKRLFDNTRVHNLDIVMNDWDEFIDNASSEEYYTANVVIDGEAYKNVAIRGKGNTSLSNVAVMDSDRYSFKIEFDQYDSAMTYHGLDKLNLNNLIQDSTMMKDYLTYTMMEEFGAVAPLCSFVYITVNGEDWGLYLAVEGVEESFLERNYGSNYGQLYKPDSMSFGGGRGNGKDFDMEDFMNREDSYDSSTQPGQGMRMPQMPDRGNFDPSQMPEGFGGGRGGFGGMGSTDVKLQYIDDNVDSYSNIWNNAKTDIQEADQIRLIESLQKLNSGQSIETVVDIDNVIRYFVVHNYVCNGDSYTGSMVHNYYLYEKDGQMDMIPWDYNLAFGTFQSGNAQSTVNTPIDSPVSGAGSEDRPMWNWIVENAEYTELYHNSYEEFLNTVDITKIIDDAYELIKPYVEKDPTAFYSYEAFETGVETLRQFCILRTESITAQLENNQTRESMDYADASGLILSDMGSMGRGGEMQIMPGNRGDFFEGGTEVPNISGIDEGIPTGRDMQGVSPSGPPAEQFNKENMSEIPGDFNPPQIPGGEFNSEMRGMETASGSIFGWLWLLLSALILCIGLVIAKIYK